MIRGNMNNNERRHNWILIFSRTRPINKRKSRYQTLAIAAHAAWNKVGIYRLISGRRRLCFLCNEMQPVDGGAGPTHVSLCYLFSVICRLGKSTWASIAPTGLIVGLSSRFARQRVKIDISPRPPKRSKKENKLTSLVTFRLADSFDFVAPWDWKDFWLRQSNRVPFGLTRAK